MLYVSRFSNPALKSGEYIAVRISLGTPKWPLGYTLAGEIKELMPFGLLGKYDRYEDFERAYFQRLNQIGANRIFQHLKKFTCASRDTVLLCYEDIRCEGEWCHRTAFAKWWMMQTGEIVDELPDLSTPKRPKQSTGTSDTKQISMFD